MRWKYKNSSFIYIHELLNITNNILDGIKCIQQKGQEVRGLKGDQIRGEANG